MSQTLPFALANLSNIRIRYSRDLDGRIKVKGRNECFTKVKLTINGPHGIAGTACNPVVVFLTVPVRDQWGNQEDLGEFSILLPPEEFLSFIRAVVLISFDYWKEFRCTASGNLKFVGEQDRPSSMQIEIRGKGMGSGMWFFLTPVGRHETIQAEEQQQRLSAELSNEHVHELLQSAGEAILTSGTLQSDGRHA